MNTIEDRNSAIHTSTTTDLDAWGRVMKVSRNVGEPDSNYRRRLKESPFKPGVCPLAHCVPGGQHLCRDKAGGLLPCPWLNLGSDTGYKPEPKDSEAPEDPKPYGTPIPATPTEPVGVAVSETPRPPRPGYGWRMFRSQFLKALETASGETLDLLGKLVLTTRGKPPLTDAAFRDFIRRAPELMKPETSAPSPKTMWTEIPAEALEETAKVFTDGHSKHGPTEERNVPIREDMDAAFRHLSSYRQGEVIDLDSGLHHLAHAAARLMLAMQRELVVEAKANGKR